MIIHKLELAGIRSFNDSCNGDQACQKVNDVTISPNSCKAAPDESGWLNCFKMAGSTVGSNSCNGSDSSCSRLQSSTVGDGSCQEAASCYANCGIGCGVRLSIGTNACNYDSVCSFCENDSVIPDNACNFHGGMQEDLTSLGVWGMIMIQRLVFVPMVP